MAESDRINFAEMEQQVRRACHEHGNWFKEIQEYRGDHSFIFCKFQDVKIYMNNEDEKPLRKWCTASITVTIIREYPRIRKDLPISEVHSLEIDFGSLDELNLWLKAFCQGKKTGVYCEVDYFGLDHYPSGPKYFIFGFMSDEDRKYVVSKLQNDRTVIDFLLSWFAAS